MKQKIYTVSFCLALVLSIAHRSFAGMASGSYIIPNPILSGGGSSAASANYALGSTLGQSSPLMDQDNPPLSSSYELYPGWWYTTAWGEPLVDTDGDGVSDAFDNCPNTYNPGQEDTYPSPGGNSCGDACECEGNFDGNATVDGLDAATFKSDFGRSSIKRPCTGADPCHGDFSCNGNVDGLDAALFKSDFGRSGINRPCPNYVTDPWCEYP